jgi:hypothetical protein
MSLKRQYVALRYPIFLCAMCLKRGTSGLRTKGGLLFWQALCLNKSSIILLNDRLLAKPGKNPSRSRNCSCNTNATVSIVLGCNRLPNASELFCFTSDSTITYVSARYSVSKPKLREAWFSVSEPSIIRARLFSSPSLPDQHLPYHQQIPVLRAEHAAHLCLRRLTSDQTCSSFWDSSSSYGFPQLLSYPRSLDPQRGSNRLPGLLVLFSQLRS